MKHNLVSKPRFRRLHRATGSDKTSTTIGRLVLVWWMADQHSTDGTMFGSFGDVDDAADCDGFAEAMESVGWLTRDGDEITFVDFGDHNGKTAKTRMTDQKRTRDKRRTDTKKADVSENVGQMSGSCPKKQDHRTEQNNTDTQEKTKRVATAPAFVWDTDCPSSLNTTPVREAYAEWASYRRERKLGAWKPRTLRTKLREFEGLGGQAFVDAVRHSIGNGYQGIFPANGQTAPTVRKNDVNIIDDGDCPLERAARIEAERTKTK